MDFVVTKNIVLLIREKKRDKMGQDSRNLENSKQKLQKRGELQGADKTILTVEFWNF